MKFQGVEILLHKLKRNEIFSLKKYKFIRHFLYVSFNCEQKKKKSAFSLRRDASVEISDVSKITTEFKCENIQSRNYNTYFIKISNNNFQKEDHR